MTRYSFAPLALALCLLAGCTVAIDEETVFVPRKVEARAADASALEIPGQSGLEATVSHALIAAANLQIATTHVTREGLGADEPLILVCMGNASDRVRSGLAYARKTMPYGDVLLFDYPGYGDSTGTPTASNLEAIRAPLIDHAEAIAAGRPILLWGHSLGGFVCAQSAGESDAIKGIVLETTAANASEVAASWKPWYMPFLNIRVADTLAGYDTPAALAKFPGPVLVIGAAKDSTLPVELHRSLQSQLKAQGANVTYLEYAVAEHYDAALQPEFETDSKAFFEAVRAKAD